MKAWLEMSQGTRHSLQGTCSIGRLPENTIVLADKRVSRRHALIYAHRDGNHWLVDFGSSNGILLNKQRVSAPTMLQDQDRLVISDHVFVYHNKRSVQAPAGDPGLKPAADPGEKTERVPQAHRADERGFIFLTAKGGIQFCTEPARRWLTRYFPAADEGVLPGDLEPWTREQMRQSKSAENGNVLGEPLIVEKDSHRLVVQFEQDQRQQLLTLVEHQVKDNPEALAGLDLTEREREVLLWIVQGKSNGDIAAILGLSPRTVHKHVEHVYQKLGVETRTAAMLRGLEVMGLTPRPDLH